jgi:hypothetical protein
MVRGFTDKVVGKTPKIDWAADFVSLDGENSSAFSPVEFIHLLLFCLPLPPFIAID